MSKQQIRNLLLVLTITSTSFFMNVQGQQAVQVVSNNPVLNLLDENNYVSYVNRPGTFDPEMGTPPATQPNYLPVPNAQVTLNGHPVDFDVQQQRYLIQQELQLPYHLKVTHQDYQPYELTIEKGEIPLPSMVILARKDELVYTQQGLPIPVPDPARYTRTAILENGEVSPGGSLLGITGCVIGTFREIDLPAFHKFVEENKIPLYHEDLQHNWFAIAPGPWTTQKAFYGEVLESLRTQAWVAEAGPILEAHPDRYLFVTKELYIQAANGQRTELEAFLRTHQDIVAISPCTDRPGFTVTVDSSLGTDILPLTRSLADHPMVAFADVHINRIVIADLRD